MIKFTLWQMIYMWIKRKEAICTYCVYCVKRDEEVFESYRCKVSRNYFVNNDLRQFEFCHVVNGKGKCKKFVKVDGWVNILNRDKEKLK